MADYYALVWRFLYRMVSRENGRLRTENRHLRDQLESLRVLLRLDVKRRRAQDHKT